MKCGQILFWDNELVNVGMNYAGTKTRNDLVESVLSGLVRHKEQKEILKLSGRLKWKLGLEDMIRSLT